MMMIKIYLKHTLEMSTLNALAVAITAGSWAPFLWLCQDIQRLFFSKALPPTVYSSLPFIYFFTYVLSVLAGVIEKTR